MRRLVFLVSLLACGARAPQPEPDYGPPSEPVDPIACPAVQLERFATRVAAPLSIGTEPILEAARIDKLPCKPAETGAACIARARQRPVPVSYEVAGVTLGGDGDIEYTYDIDGRRVTESAASLELMVTRLKRLQAAGHAITVIAGGRDGDEATRHAAIAYRAVGLRQRRVGTLRWRVDDPARTMAEAHEAAVSGGIEIRAMEVGGDGELVITATCGAGANS